MALHRPAVLAYAADRRDYTGYKAIPYKDGADFPSGPVTPAPPRNYTPTDWAYRSFGADPNAGVLLAGPGVAS
jgi:hypothetical protein